MPKELMYLVKCGDEDAYNVFYNNGKHMGLIYKEVDGYFVYWDQNKAAGGGFVEAAQLHWLADKLDEINKPWHDIVMSDPQLNPNWEEYVTQNTQ